MFRRLLHLSAGLWLALSLAGCPGRNPGSGAPNASANPGGGTGEVFSGTDPFEALIESLSGELLRAVLVEIIAGNHTTDLCQFDKFCSDGKNRLCAKMPAFTKGQQDRCRQVLPDFAKRIKTKMDSGVVQLNGVAGCLKYKGECVAGRADRATQTILISETRENEFWGNEDGEIDRLGLLVDITHEWVHLMDYVGGTIVDEQPFGTEFPSATNGGFMVATAVGFGVSFYAQGLGLDTAIGALDPKLGWCPQGELHVGNFNGDQRPDLLRHGHTSGHNSIAYVDGGVYFSRLTAKPGEAGSVWRGAIDDNWCGGAETSLAAIADFNGDDRDDLLCFVNSKHDVEIAYASTEGTFFTRPTAAGHPAGNPGTTWKAGAGWCENGRTLALDTNADGASELLCVAPLDKGGISVAFPTAAGTFNLTGGTGTAGGPGTVSVSPTSWCTQTWCQGPLEVLTSDFNADGRPDLHLKQATTGRFAIAYADSNGTYFTRLGALEILGAPGTVFSPSSAYCGPPQRVLSADIDGNGRADLLCSIPPWNLYLAYSTQQGVFFTTNDPAPGGQWTHAPWCSAASTLSLIDLNGDARADQICEATTGTRTIAYATTAGTYLPANASSLAPGTPGAEWTDPLSWCPSPQNRYFLELRQNGTTDLLCWNRTTGELEIRFNRSGKWGGIEWTSRTLGSVEPTPTPVPQPTPTPSWAQTFTVLQPYDGMQISPSADLPVHGGCSGGTIEIWGTLINGIFPCAGNVWGFVWDVPPVYGTHILFFRNYDPHTGWTTPTVQRTYTIVP